MTRLQHCFLYALAIVCAQVAFATPYLNLGLLGAPTWLQLLSALVSCGLFLSGAYWVVRTINSISFSPWRFLTSLSKRDWIILIVIVGCILRVVWDAIFPSLPTSDAATYVDLGQKLSRGETYFIGGTYAYWPPGYPFLLGVLYYFVGYSEAAMLALNIFIYGVTIWVVYGLAEHVLDDYSARPMSRRTIGFAQIGDFKGLESEVVVLVDIPVPGRSDTLRPHHYVGMSRARAVLSMICEP